MQIEFPAREENIPSIVHTMGYEKSLTNLLKKAFVQVKSIYLIETKKKKLSDSQFRESNLPLALYLFVRSFHHNNFGYYCTSRTRDFTSFLWWNYAEIKASNVKIHFLSVTLWWLQKMSFMNTIGSKSGRISQTISCKCIITKWRDGSECILLFAVSVTDPRRGS